MVTIFKDQGLNLLSVWWREHQAQKGKTLPEYSSSAADLNWSAERVVGYFAILQHNSLPHFLGVFFLAEGSLSLRV